MDRSVSPHDIFDSWVEEYGRTLDAFSPVADTGIGRLGVMTAAASPSTVGHQRFTYVSGVIDIEALRLDVATILK